MTLSPLPFYIFSVVVLVTHLQPLKQSAKVIVLCSSCGWAGMLIPSVCNVQLENCLWVLLCNEMSLLMLLQAASGRIDLVNMRFVTLSHSCVGQKSNS